VAHARALEIFGERGLGCTVGEVVEGVTNNVRSFLVAWDGSTEGWLPSDEGDAARAQLVQWLRDQEYEDGSSPLWWVEVQYSGDDRDARVLAHGRDGAYPRTERPVPR